MNKEFLEIINRSIEIHQKKNDDYTSGDVDENFNRMTEIQSWFKNDIDKTFATMIAVKLARLATLLNKSTSPNFESIEDTFVDLVTYAGLWGGNYKRRKLNTGAIYENHEQHEMIAKAYLESLHEKPIEVISNREMRIPLQIREPGPNFITPQNKKINEITSIMARELNDDECRQLLALARTLVRQK